MRSVAAFSLILTVAACGDDSAKNSSITADNLKLGETVSGLTGNAEIHLYKNGADELIVSHNDMFQFAATVAKSDDYEISVDDSSYYGNCHVSEPSGHIGTQNKADLAVLCNGPVLASTAQAAIAAIGADETRGATRLGKF